MTTLSEYLEQCDEEIDTVSREALSRLTYDQFQIVMEAARHISSRQDPKPGVACHVNILKNSLFDLDKSRFYKWAFGGFRDEVTFGVPTVAYRFARPRADDPWLSLVVLDFDGFRVAVYAWAEDCVWASCPE